MFDFLAGLFGGGNGDEDRYSALFNLRNQQADDANNRAIDASKQADELLRAAMVDPLDDENARKRSEARQRKLQSSSQPDLGPLGAAPVGYTMLMGGA